MRAVPQKRKNKGTMNEKVSVTQEQVNENMQAVSVQTLEDFGKKITHVSVRMKNGFVLTEDSICVDPANYDENIGKDVCLGRIENKVWFLLGYALQDKIANTPKDYKERMLREYVELKERTEKLDAFFKTDTYKALDIDRQKLMERQFKAMAEYQDILRLRIEREGITIE